MINNLGERLINGFNDATDRVTSSLFKPLGAMVVGIAGGVGGGYGGYRLMHDSIPSTPTPKAGEVLVHVAEAIAGGAGAATGLLVGVGVGVVVLGALPSRR